MGKLEFQEIEEIQMSCRKIYAGERSANLPLKDFLGSRLARKVGFKFGLNVIT